VNEQPGDEQQLSLLEEAPDDEDESWEAWWASLPRIPGARRLSLTCLRSGRRHD
jgi:hypothetical protein